jgi:glycosyltransferase involved in cell wall biosynthesis
MTAQTRGDLDLTVITCTHNPRRDILDRVLEALSKQTLPQSRWELIVIDNCSKPPLDAADLNAKWGLPLRVVHEPVPGVASARRRGVSEAAADLICMVDDDNVLDPDYLAVGLEIARAEPTIGAFGGAIRPILERGAAWNWQKKLLPYLGVRDYGPEVITSSEDKWGQWEPIGAGMVVRKDVTEKYIEIVAAIPLAKNLGRKGKGLLAGEDSLFARAAYRLGYSCSYQPRLKFQHYIKSNRMKMGYLIRLLYGHGKSVVMLDSVLGKPTAPIGWGELFGRLPFRFWRDGISGLICWAWDVGFMLEARAEAREAAAEGTTGGTKPGGVVGA